MTVREDGKLAIHEAAGLDQIRSELRAGREGYGEDALVVCDQLVRIYTADGVEVQALQGLDLLVKRGELLALVGASGSGKSTLLNILGGMDRPTAGSLRVDGRDVAAMRGAAWLDYRRKTVGFVWQQTARNLVPYLTARQNAALPMRFSGTGRRKRNARADELLEMLGVAYCRDRRPHQMSGGEQQRVAIATACANGPTLLLADEPTGELDTKTAADVFGALRTMNAELGVTVLIVTHDHMVAGQVDRTVAIRDGRTSTETLRHTVTGDDGEEVRHAVEYAVLDRAGRLQMPAAMIRRLQMRDRVRLEEEADHVGVWPGQTRPEQGVGEQSLGEQGLDGQAGERDGD
ncbi:ABC transporter ATP-binding protein [Actinospica robiniae]|uniref:ABC transporter ATP-binding protein n=1 Tax=Actinospica robiniae TaxID=304901 RepID=UPI000414FD95|nr:ABC transporter ATP-binding protein [Actinospica robiniae]